MASGGTYDVIVLGMGSMGSSACYHLARRGARVLGLEQFGVPNTLSSHAGQSRIIRKAYFEHPDYVPLLEAAYRNWKALEAATGEKVYHATGLLYFGQPGHPVMEGVKESSRIYDIHLSSIPTSRYPQLSAYPGHEWLFEPDAGFVEPEKAIRLYAQEAERHGAVIRTHQQVLGWQQGRPVTVTTAEGTYTCDKLVVCAGPWAGRMLPSLQRHLRVTRQLLAWVTPKDPASFALGNFPCWMYAEDGMPGVYYGFPGLPAGLNGPSGIKIAYHAAGELTDPDHVRREVGPGETDDLVRVLKQFFRKGYADIKEVKVCLYTNSPDEHFIIDHLPGSPDITVAAGFSGHGFKFASVVGEILADLALDGRTAHPITFLSASRRMDEGGPATD
jgi:sarcosine oxidase